MAYTYLSPFSGFNAWANYNTPEENKGFNYTMDPFYNVAGDQQRWDLAQTGANSETNRARVWRWTLDNLRAQGLDPGKAPQATVNQYYLNNIGRLRQDYQANGFDWNRSGFSGYDKFLQTDPSKMPGGPRPTDPAGNPIDPSTIGNKGPNTSPPVKNPGLPTPNPGVNGGYNAALADQLNSNPDYAFRYMLRQLGFDPNAPSRFVGNVGEQSAVEQYLNQLATLKYAGSNPMIQQSIADTIQRGQQQYEDFTTEQLTSGQSLGDPYLEWLRRNPAYNRYLGVH
jgi:hypothetical protein